MCVTFQAEKIKEEMENKDEDEIEELVRSKFQNLNNMFLSNSKSVEELVISKKPKKPIRSSQETDENTRKNMKVRCK